jgi:hypothetical protein
VSTDTKNLSNVRAEFSNVCSRLAADLEEYAVLISFQEINVVDHPSSGLSLDGGPQRGFLVDLPGELVQHAAQVIIRDLIVEKHHAYVLLA